MVPFEHCGVILYCWLIHTLKSPVFFTGVAIMRPLCVAKVSEISIAMPSIEAFRYVGKQSTGSACIF